MTTLITGGASKIGSRLAVLLKNAGGNVMFGSRSGRVPDGFKSVKLDWDDSSTFSNPFDDASIRGTMIENAYLMGPDIPHPQSMIPFIELAVEKGVKRFVYLSATIADKDNDAGGLGKIHNYLEKKGLDYVVLRPTWFIDNLGDYADDIRKNVIRSIVPTGKIPFVWSGDIAKVAFDAFSNKSLPFPTRDPLIIGPELLSYTDVANILSDVLGRKILHTVVSVEEMKATYLELYGTDEDAEWVVELDRGLESGSEEGLEQAPGVIVGKLSLREWVKEHRPIFDGPQISQ
ncbi:ergot alkaloid A [Coprinopsis marcescibilis]|uniref:Ergot alkaloid A n=1 Tax=Coprinopsis marcescibilis TaxID=230819 RepID=A0A5C3KVF3_COPMA|nr:ergot alkaloid A [Coprinopsis marcescibilis]